jgi:hypothetical protein
MHKVTVALENRDLVVSREKILAAQPVHQNDVIRSSLIQGNGDGIASLMERLDALDRLWPGTAGKTARSSSRSTARPSSESSTHLPGMAVGDKHFRFLILDSTKRNPYGRHQDDIPHLLFAPPGLRGDNRLKKTVAVCLYV